MYSTHNEGISVTARRVEELLELQRIKYTNTRLQYQKMCIFLTQTIQLINTTIHIKDNTHIDSSKKVDNKDPKFEIGDHLLKAIL